MTTFRSWFSTFIAVSTLIVSGTVFADTSLVIPRPYVSYLVDGKSHKNDGNPIELASGAHQVVIRFEGNYSTRSNTNLVSAEPLVVNFETNGQEQLTFDMPKIRDSVQANQFVKKQNLHLIDQKTKAVKAADIFVLPKKEGLQIGRDYQEELLALGKAFQQPMINQDGTISAANEMQLTNTAVVATDNKQIQTLEMLKYWYNRADPQTRKAFQHWVISQQ